MSAGARKNWLVAYDIRDKRRLARVHRFLRSEGTSLQYSVFAVEATDKELQRLLFELRQRIDGRQDDVRAYHVPASCEIFTLGRQALPPGVVVGASVVMDLLTSHSPEEQAETEASHFDDWEII